MTGPPRPYYPPPDGPWHRSRPPDGDETTVARPRPAPPRNMPPPPRPVPPYRPPAGPYRPPVAPWYQRPVRPMPQPAPAPPARPPVNQHQGDAAAGKRRIRRLLLGAGILVVLAELAVLLGGVSRLNSGGAKVLDVAKVQAGVVQILSDPASGYGANTVTGVSCNDGRNPSARKGTTFTCAVTVNGAERHVWVLVSDDDGTYEVDRPR